MSRIWSAELSNGEDAIFEGAFYYDLGKGVKVIETEEMRFRKGLESAPKVRSRLKSSPKRLARWRKERKKNKESIDFGEYVRDVFTNPAEVLSTEVKSEDFDLSAGYELLTRCENINMSLERANPELYNRRKVLESYRHREKTPEVPKQVPVTPDNVGQTVIIKKSESKLQKKKESRILGPEDFGIDMKAYEASLKRVKAEPTRKGYPLGCPRKIF